MTNKKSVKDNLLDRLGEPIATMVPLWMWMKHFKFLLFLPCAIAIPALDPFNILKNAFSFFELFFGSNYSENDGICFGNQSAKPKENQKLFFNDCRLQQFHELEHWFSFHGIVS